MNVLLLRISPIKNLSNIAFEKLIFSCSLKKNEKIIESFTYEQELNYSSTNNFFNDLAFCKVGDEILSDYFKISSFYFWQFMPSFIWPRIYHCLRLQAGVEALLDKYQPSKVEFIIPRDGTFREVRELIKVNCIKKGVLFEDLSTPPLFFNFYYFFKSSSFGLILGFIIRQLSFFIKKLKINRASNLLIKSLSKIDVMFLTYGERYFKKNGLHYSDENFSSIISLLNKDGFKTGLVDLDDSKLNTGFLNKFSFIEFGYILSIPELFKLFLFFFSAIKKYIQLTRRFSESEILLNGIDVKYSILPILRAGILDFSVLSYIYLLKADRILSEKLPKAICLTYETGPVQRAFLIVAKRKNICSFGYQHGMIFSNHYDYSHKYVNENANQSFEFIIPSQLFVWGSYWGKVLSEIFNYSKININSVGYWKYKTFESEDYKCQDNLQRLSIGLFSTCFRTVDFINDILLALKGNQNLKIYVKLHPSEQSLNFQSYLKSRIDSELFFLNDLHEAIGIVDIVISQYSTAVSEAILYNKEVILCDFYNIDYPPVYENYNVVKIAKNSTDLPRLLREDFVLSEESRSRFIKDFFGEYKTSNEIISKTIINKIK
jgi:hypothetical protein